MHKHADRDTYESTAGAVSQDEERSHATSIHGLRSSWSAGVIRVQLCDQHDAWIWVSVSRSSSRETTVWQTGDAIVMPRCTVPLFSRDFPATQGAECDCSCVLSLTSSKGAVHAPVGDWTRRPIPMRLFLVIDLDELSKLLAYEKSLSTIVSEISSLKVRS